MKKNLLPTNKNFFGLRFLSNKQYFYLIFLLFTFGSNLQAQTAGPNNAGTGTSVIGIGTVAWTNPSFMTAADAADATSVLGANAISNYLRGTNYGFSIPSGAIINGISVTINRRSSSDAATKSIKDNTVQLVKNGTIVGTNRANTVALWPTTKTPATYGTPIDLWGTTWTVADINNSNFGIVLAVNAPTSARDAFVDYIQITVHYNAITFTPATACFGSGASIVITGNNLNSTSAVTFNGVAATFVQNSPTQITATLPVSATTGVIGVTIPSGTITSSANFIVNSLPVVSAPSAVCVGNTIQLSPSSGGTWVSNNTAKATVNNSGLVTGVASGSATFTFTNSTTGCNATTTAVTINALPTVNPITGTTAVCVGLMTSLFNTTTGGVWNSASPTIATINSSGVVSGIANGTSIISYTVTDANSCAKTVNTIITVNALPTVSGPSAVCVEKTIQLSPAVGGTWISNATANATVTNSGLVTGVSSGNATFTFTNTITNCSATTTNITVNPLPAVNPITGILAVCIGFTTALNNTTSGGTWASATPSVAVINSSGDVTGIAAGTSVITYTFTNGNGCTSSSSATITVNALPTVSPITGTTSVCVGLTTSLFSTTTGGFWSSASPTIATINSSGIATGITNGTSIISYTVTDANSCAKTVNTTITVNGLPTVSGPSAVCVGKTIQLSPAVGGTWISNDTAIATVTNSGLVTGVSSGNATFTFTNTITNCSATTTNVTVNPLPAVNPITGTLAVCIGFTTTLNNTTSGGTWTSATPSVAAINSSGVVSGIANGTSVITYTFTNSNGCTSTSNATVTVNAFPIVSAPTAVCIGSTIQIVPSNGGTWISNDTTKATVDNSGIVTGVASGNTTFTFTNSTTGCSASTNAVTILVSPTIISHPVISQTVCTGNSVNFSIIASASGLTYQWYNGITPLTNGNGISGVGTATLTINPVTISAASANYNCVISGTCAPNVTSNNAELLVNQMVAITTQPANSQVTCTGAAVSFSIAATGSGLTYQWYKGATALVNGGTVSGVTTDTLTISAAVVGDASSSYNCIVSGSNPCNPVMSNNATLVVNQTVSIVSQPAISQTVCPSSSVSFSVSGSGGSLTYQWYKGAATLSNGGGISGVSTDTLTINSVSVSDVASDYYCIISNGCATSATSNNAALNLYVTPAIPSQTVTICSTTTFNVTPTNGVPSAATVVPANTTYSWSAPTVTGGITGGSSQTNQTAISGSLTNPTNSNQTATYTVTPNYGATGACVGLPFSVTVTVKPNPSIINLTTAVCTGSLVTINPINGSGNIVPASTLYSWGIPTVTGGITGGTALTNQSNFNQTLSNPTSSPQTATYNVTGIANSCFGNTFTIVVTVNPNPVVIANIATQTTCSGVSYSPILISNPSNVITTYNWTRNNTINVTGVSNGNSGAIAAGAAFSITHILTNTTTTAQTVVYTITPTTNGCVGNPILSTVVVETASIGGAVTISQPNVTPAITTITVCHFASGTLYLSGHTGNVVRWEYSTTGGNTWISVANTTTTYTYTNMLVTTVVRAVIQNGSFCARANATSAILNVIPNIKPSPVTAVPNTICVGGSSNLFSQSGFATSQNIASGGTFSDSNPVNWSVDGCGNCLNAGSSNTNPNPFQLSATNGGIYSGINYTSSGKFAIANGNFNSIMQTPVFNTLGLTTASLSFNHAFNLLAGASVKVELSLDGGATYNIVLADYYGVSTRSPYNAFPNSNIDLNSYIGQSNLKVRFNYQGTVGSSWAVDDILIPQQPENLTTQWVDSTSGLVISNTATVTVTPIVTTTYAVTSYLNGCSSYGSDGTTYVTVFVNQKPTANIGPSQTICNNGTATFNVTLSGTAPWNLTYSNGTTSTTVNNITTNPYVFSVNNIITNQVYTITALSDTKCASIATDMTGSANVTVLNGTQGLWTGLVSKDWFDCKNWAGGLPSSTVNAVIPAGSSRMPVINPASIFAPLYSGIASAQDIIIASGASVDMAANSILQISRDWKNSGVFSSGTGTVSFIGATINQVQTINLGIKTSETFYNLLLNNSNSAKGISIVDGFQLTVSNNLSLISGDLRLTGEAQLIQTGISANPSGGNGKLLIDQQGTKSSFNYNYWSSPVSSDNTTYTISDILRDGTDVTTNPFNPGTITFGNGGYFADGAVTNPIKISNRWLYKYTLVSNSYFSWQAIGSVDPVKVGEGYTMKGTDGTAAVTTLQNYVFTGKPNNGTILLNIALTQSYLVGNPYASALNADEFIKDNIKDGGNAASNIINGALYFWNHYGGQTHFTSGYVGGYATYTLMGGVVAIANDPLNINDGSTGTKVPKKFIPVGQGFFIGTNLATALTTNNPNLSSAITGGTVTFKNSQRAFKTESPANSVFLRSTMNVANNQNDDRRPKIRLKYNSPSGLYRQLLVGVDNNSTTLFDIGYDAPMIDVNANDMYWEVSNAKFVIQAIPDFNFDRVIPFGIKITTLGESSIKIHELENILDDTAIYLHDNVTGIYHDLKNGNFVISLPIGVYNNRFSICFSNESSTIISKAIIKDKKAISVEFINSTSILNIKNNLEDTTIKTVYLFNLLGQPIANWNIENQEQQDIQIPIQNIIKGTYIVKIKTNGDAISKKIIIK